MDRDHPGGVVFCLFLLGLIALNAAVARAAMRRTLLTLSADSLARQGIFINRTTRFADICLLEVREKPSGSIESVRLLSTKGDLVQIDDFEHMDTIAAHLDATIPATAIRYRKRYAFESESMWPHAIAVTAAVALLIAYIASEPDVRRLLSFVGPWLFFPTFVIETWRRRSIATRLTSLFARRPSPLRSGA